MYCGSLLLEFMYIHTVLIFTVFMICSVVALFNAITKSKRQESEKQDECKFGHQLR